MNTDWCRAGDTSELFSRSRYSRCSSSSPINVPYLLVISALSTGHLKTPSGGIERGRLNSIERHMDLLATERFHRWDFHPLEHQLASLDGLFHPLQHAGLSRLFPDCRQFLN